MKLFLQKKCKILERWELRPQTPVPPAAGGFAPKPPASGGWGLNPRPPKQPPPLQISGYAPGRHSVYYCPHWTECLAVIHSIKILVHVTCCK